VDTCGYAPWKALDSIREYTDLFLYDLKLMDDRRHSKHTGAANKKVIDNLERLAISGAKVIVRYAVIPGINDDEENIREMARFVAKLKRIERIDVLPYHSMAVEKYSNLNRKGVTAGFRPPSEERLRIIVKALEGFGLKVNIGG